MITHKLSKVLKNKNKCIVKIVDVNMKGAKLKWDTYVSHKFPETPIYILSSYNYSSELLSIMYLNDKMNLNDIFVPKDLEVKLCTVKEKKVIQKVYDYYVVNHMKFVIQKYPLGSDPEIFVEDKDANLIPAYEFLPDKKRPISVAWNNLYWDGFQCEFTTRAEQCLAWQVDSVQVGLKTLLQHARKYNKDARLSTKTCMTVPSELLKTGKDEHIEFGCMPSENVYGMKGLSISGRELPYRSSGGHIHFGFGKKSKKEIDRIVKTLDAILGVACVSMFAEYDDPKRRTCYGLAGEYRTPSHGLEYRVLSNAWMFHPLIMNVVFDVARAVASFGMNDLLKYWDGNEKETIEVINTCDVKQARIILKRNEKMFKKIIHSCYPLQDTEAIRLLYDAFYNGMDSVVKDAKDFETNWNLSPNANWKEHSDGIGKNILHGMPVLIEGKKVA